MDPEEPNPYAPPGEAAPPEKKKKKKKRGRYTARFESSDTLVVSQGAELPDVCMKCGIHDEIMRRPAKFQWTPLWSRMLLPFCALGGILAMALTRKHAELAVPLCVPCNGRWSAARNVSIAGVVLLILTLVGLRMTEAGQLFLGALLAAVAVFLVVTFAFVRPRMLRTNRIDDDDVHLVGVAHAAAQEIVDGSQ